MVVFTSLFMAFSAMVVGLFFMGIGRKVTARLQRRYGPPFWQSYIDTVKCFSRKSISHSYIQDFGSMMGLAGLIAAAMFVPIAGWLPFPSASPIIVILYLMPIGYLGMAMGVSASGNPLAAVGIGRALTMMLGYEVPYAILLLTFIASSNTSSLAVLSHLQSGGVANWFAVKMPIGFIASIICLQAMLGEKPFDSMIAPAEIGSGPMVELSGKFLGMAFLQHAVAIFIETGLIVNMYLGGGTTVWIFLLKQFLLYVFAMAVNGIYGRYRVEQAVRFLWIFAGSLALIQLLINLF